MTHSTTLLLLILALLLGLGRQRFGVRTSPLPLRLHHRGHSSTSRWTARNSRVTRGS
jgi:hypothetical protein